jgi:hypothetical protein
VVLLNQLINVTIFPLFRQVVMRHDLVARHTMPTWFKPSAPTGKDQPLRYCTWSSFFVFQPTSDGYRCTLFRRTFKIRFCLQETQQLLILSKKVQVLWDFW